MVIRLTLAGLLLVVPAIPLYAQCRAPDWLGKNGVTRPPNARDLIELRDMAFPDAAYAGGAAPLGVSSDGSRLALMVTQADVNRNSHCRFLVTVDLTGNLTANVVADGGDPILSTFPYRGLSVPSGAFETVAPAWSHDDRWIVYKKRSGGSTQLWRSRPDGSMTTPLTMGLDEVGRWTFDQGRIRVLFAIRPSLLEHEERNRAEASQGYLYDGRTWPMFNFVPLPPADVSEQIRSADPETGDVRAADAREVQWWRESAAALAIAEDGTSATTDPETAAPIAPRYVALRRPNGSKLACPAAECREGITAAWWVRGSSELVFLRREGWNKGASGIYGWTPGKRRIRRILATRAWIVGCAPAGSELVCAEESARTPQRIVAIGLVRGAVRQIFDPNPGFHEVALGSVRRLTWSNDQGLPAYGDLVLPLDLPRGRKVPLVVVQYNSRGFLRGGTGDEYPIYLLAARGLAVLSIERPPIVAVAKPNLKTWDEVTSVIMKNWADRRSIFSAVMNGIDMAVASAPIDPDRIGITGLSDGSMTVAYALINSRRFKAAAMSSCCYEPHSTLALSDTGFGEIARTKWGWPNTTAASDDFWRPQALSLSASRIDVPLLIQQADREAILALETVTALRESGKPVEFRIYPDEYHIKWQPAHRLSVYNRAVDWFDYWLNGSKDDVVEKRDQYDRWDTMRASLPSDRQLTIPSPTPRHPQAAAPG